MLAIPEILSLEERKKTGRERSVWRDKRRRGGGGGGGGGGGDSGEGEIAACISL